MSKTEGKQFQDDLSQYQMPDALKQEKNYSYRVGYEASTGNKTDPAHTEEGKRT
ncbi:hypothetical protein ACFFIX_05290 [Metabacillus herbersteinensis]|uniref:YfhE family protein n=1 Tax=Metabacillus herbersteinensis TaxID=283816 RepID=A0ABV6GB09_9BACI